MADDTEFDISSLTEEQQTALQTFTSVTDQDLAHAVPLLRRCEWNVQIAIARFFDGEPAVQAEEPAPPPPSQSIRRQENLMNGFSQGRRHAGEQFEPAPRVVSQPESQINQQPPFILSILLTPVNVLYNFFSRAFSVFSYLFPFLPRILARFKSRAATTQSRSNASGRRPLGPQDTTARFLREFEEEYGSHALPFLETGYARAFDIAKKELKFLLAIPLSPEHDDNAAFIRNTLLAEPVTSFLNDPSNNILLWAGSVQDSEAYQVSSSLNITKFPTAVLIVHTPSVSSTAMSVVERISGLVSSEEFLAKLQTAITKYSEPLSRARATRSAQQATRDLRDQQNTAYERSLAADRERARQKREAEEQRVRQERAEKERIAAEEQYDQKLRQWRKWRATQIPDEPGADVKDAVRISIRLQDGQRIMRRFSPESPIDDVYAYVECHDVLEDEQGTVMSEKKVEKPTNFTYRCPFRLVSPMPREVFDIETGGTVKNRFGRSGNLIVERIEQEDDEGDSP